MLTIPDPFVQDILDELAEADDLAPPPTPVSAAAAAAAARRADAARKRDERAKKRELGVPDWRTVDLAIACAVADACRREGSTAQLVRNGKVAGIRLDLGAVVQTALQSLYDRGVPKSEAVKAVRLRLFPPTQPEG